MDLRLGRNWKPLQLVGLIALAVVTVVVSVLALTQYRTPTQQATPAPQPATPSESEPVPSAAYNSCGAPIQPVGPARVETDLPEFAPNSALDIARRFACSPGTPPDSQTVPGLWSALAGIRAHFAPGGPADQAAQTP